MSRRRSTPDLPPSRYPVAVSPLPILPLLPLAILLGCGQADGVLWVHNGSPEGIRLEGLPDGPQDLAAGKDLRVDGVGSPLPLVARSNSGREMERVDFQPPPPGGAAVWSVGGTACYAQGDFSAYYGPAELPAGVEVLAVMKPGDRLLVGQGRVVSGPGERLPKSLRGGAVRAIFQIPCAAARSTAVARGWLEMMLPELEPP